MAEKFDYPDFEEMQDEYVPSSSSQPPQSPLAKKVADLPAKRKPSEMLVDDSDDDDEDKAKIMQMLQPVFVFFGSLGTRLGPFFGKIKPFLLGSWKGIAVAACSAVPFRKITQRLRRQPSADGDETGNEPIPNDKRLDAMFEHSSSPKIIRHETTAAKGGQQSDSAKAAKSVPLIDDEDDGEGFDWFGLKIKIAALATMLLLLVGGYLLITKLTARSGEKEVAQDMAEQKESESAKGDTLREITPPTVAASTTKAAAAHENNASPFSTPKPITSTAAADASANNAPSAFAATESSPFALESASAAPAAANPWPGTTESTMTDTDTANIFAAAPAFSAPETPAAAPESAFSPFGQPMASTEATEKKDATNSGMSLPEIVENEAEALTASTETVTNAADKAMAFVENVASEGTATSTEAAKSSAEALKAVLSEIPETATPPAASPFGASSSAPDLAATPAAPGGFSLNISEPPTANAAQAGPSLAFQNTPVNEPETASTFAAATSTPPTPPMEPLAEPTASATNNANAVMPGENTRSTALANIAEPPSAPVEAAPMVSLQSTMGSAKVLPPHDPTADLRAQPLEASRSNAPAAAVTAAAETFVPQETPLHVPRDPQITLETPATPPPTPPSAPYEPPRIAAAPTARRTADTTVPVIPSESGPMIPSDPTPTSAVLPSDHDSAISALAQSPAQPGNATFTAPNVPTTTPPAAMPMALSSAPPPPPPEPTPDTLMAAAPTGAIASTASPMTSLLPNRVDPNTAPAYQLAEPAPRYGNAETGFAPPPALSAPPSYVPPPELSQATVPAASDTPQVGQMYTVPAGETYWTISEKAYGTGRLYQALARHNRATVADPRRLQGATIEIPAREILERHAATTVPTSGAAPLSTGAAYSSNSYSPASSSPASAPTASLASYLPSSNPVSLASSRPTSAMSNNADGIIYIVQEGDDLFTIAQNKLGSVAKYTEIYALNRDKIDPNNHAIRPGTELLLPMAGNSRNIQRR